MSESPQKILYVDMDNTLVDFKSGIDLLHQDAAAEYEGRLDEVPGIFATMRPLEGAVAAFIELATLYDAYILSTAPWRNPSAWSDKVMWVQRYFGIAENTPAHKRLILSHNKNLNHGDFIVDDRIHNGVKDFTGEHIYFGQGEFRTWTEVLTYLRARA